MTIDLSKYVTKDGGSYVEIPLKGFSFLGNQSKFDFFGKFGIQ